MTVDLNLPTFGLDCREWLVATEAEGLLAEDNDAAPIVAVLSTAIVVGEELVSAQAVFSLALLDDDGSPEEVRAGATPHGSPGDSLPVGAFPVTTRTTGTTDADVVGVQDDGAQWAGRDICVLDADWSAGYARFAVPAPGGGLAVVAEFSSATEPSQELIDRFYDLVTSFHWS